MFSMALESWRPSSSARSSRSSSPPVSTRTPSKTIVPSARREPRSGTVSERGRGVAFGVRDDLRPRARASPIAAGAERVVGADAQMPRATSCRVRRRLQHEMTRAAIVNPDRRAIGAEQAVRAVAEDVEAGRRGSASRTGCAANSSSSARTSRCSSSLCAQAEQLERGQERVGRFATSPGNCDVGRRRDEADREQADALLAAHQRQEQRRRRVQARRQIRHLPIRRRRRASARAARTPPRRAPLRRRRRPRIGPQLVEAEARRRLQHAVARVVLEEQRADAAGARRGRAGAGAGRRSVASDCAPGAMPAAAGAVPASPEAEPEAGRVSRRVRVSRGIACSRGDPRFYCEWFSLR